MEAEMSNCGTIDKFHDDIDCAPYTAPRLQHDWVIRRKGKRFIVLRDGKYYGKVVSMDGNQIGIYRRDPNPYIDGTTRTWQICFT